MSKASSFRIKPGRGYLLFFIGLVLGIIVAGVVSSVYYRSSGLAVVKGLPEKVEITFLYTSEKQGWIEEVTPGFKEWFKERFGFDVEVKLIVAGTHETINMILHGLKPTAWSPASSIWIPYLNKKWAEEHGGEVIATEWVPLVYSPIVIAGWEDFVKRYNVTCFMDLYRLAKSGVSFKWGHPDPRLSNGGTMTIILEFAEAAGKRPEDLTIEDLKNETVIQIVKAIESRAVYYGKSTGFFGAYAAEKGPDEIHFFGIYESVVLENSLKALKKWNDSIVAIYPEMGTLMADHPFVILNGSWVTPWQRFAAGQYLFFLLLPENQELAEKHGFRPAISSVPLDKEIFSQSNGVKYEIDVPILKPPKGEVMEAIFKAWVRVRNTGL